MAVPYRMLQNPGRGCSLSSGRHMRCGTRYTVWSSTMLKFSFTWQAVHCIGVASKFSRCQFKLNPVVVWSNKLVRSLCRIEVTPEDALDALCTLINVINFAVYPLIRLQLLLNLGMALQTFRSQIRSQWIVTKAASFFEICMRSITLDRDSFLTLNSSPAPGLKANPRLTSSETPNPSKSRMVSIKPTRDPKGFILS